jgi:DNA-binding LacI/PurR family transcriptional regulator
MASKLERQSERTTLHEVADLAGVSATTVSIVLAGKGSHRRISEATRAKVRRAAEDLNYAPNLLVRSLRRGRTHILSFFSAFRQREEADLYMDKLSSAIEKAGGDAGYDVLVHCNFNRSPREIYQFLNGGLADGLILFAPQATDPLLQLLRKCALPVVILNGRDEERHFPSVRDNVEEGMRLVARELVSRGHRRIAVLTPHTADARDADTRRFYFQRFLREQGVEVPERWVRPASEDAKELLTELMSEQEPPTAVFCWHDRLAYGVLESCDSLGIDVPGRLSVVGYDGLPWPFATRHVAASVHVDLHHLARSSVHILDQYINGYDGALREEVLPVSFNTGTSLGSGPYCNGAFHEKTSS